MRKYNIAAPQVALALIVSAVVCLTGCSSGIQARHTTVSKSPPSAPLDSREASSQVRPVSHEAAAFKTASIEAQATPIAVDAEFDLFDGDSTLDADRLVGIVLDRNPTLNSLEAAWRAAAARYPQAIALDDPMFDVMLAPGSFARTSNVPDSWAFEAGQKLPWPGKRQYRGQAASASARAARLDARDYRLELAMLTRLALADYALAVRLLELNEAEQQLADELRAIADVKYETNQAPQQEALQAALEASETRKRKVGYVRRRQTAIARINALLHRHPSAELPAPPPNAVDAAVIDDLDLLMALAERSRPDLMAQSARIRAARAEYCLAVAEFKPDVEAYGRYDTFWLDGEQQGSVGVRLNVPIQREKRRAGVREARAREAQARHEYQALLAKIRFDVQAAREALIEADSLAALYESEITPLAERSAASARAAYETGGATFLAALSAQREWLSARREAIEAAADRERGAAELRRAVGDVQPSPPGNE